MPDPYVNPATGCLRNLLGITNPTELQNAERVTSMLREQSIRAHGLPGDFDLAHLQLIHRTVFQDIYAWAGSIRTVDTSRTHPFCRAKFIEEQATKLFEQLAESNHLKNLVRSEFVEQLTHYFSELNAIHPFRDGNGRTQRLFFELLAREAGYRLDWSRTNEHQNVEACVSAMEGITEELRNMLGLVVLDAVPGETG